MTARTFHRWAVVTTIGVCLVIVAGGVVRLTGSGLGCDDWPNCNTEHFVDVSSTHAAIEQINRLVSALIGIPTLVVAIGSFRVRPRRDGLIGPSTGLLVAILANGVLGGLTVRGDLHPALVQSHFVLALVAVTLGMVVADRSGDRAPAGVGASPVDLRRWLFVVTAGTAAAIVTGTVVTGTGPHAGDENTRRWGFDISTVARIHGLVVLATIGFVVVLFWRLRGAALPRRVWTALSTWMFVAIVQGAVGYLQYFNGVPEVLVAVHVAGATLLWVATVHLLQVTTPHQPSPQPAEHSRLVGSGGALPG